MAEDAKNREMPGGWSFDASPRLVIGVLGALAAVIATFLPRAESAELLHIANNTLMANGDGIIVVIFALGAAAAAVRDSSKPDVSWPLVILGVVTIGLAIVEGAGDRQEVINGLGEQVDSTIGPAIWALGIGGALIILSGFLQPKEPAPAERLG